MANRFCPEDYYVLLQQDVRSIAVGHTFHYSRMYVPLWQDVVIKHKKYLSFL